MRRLRSALSSSATETNEPLDASLYREFTDREPNRVWAQKLWRWAACLGPEDVLSGTGEVVGHTVGRATHLVQLQDDVIPAPNFWPALTAMVTANPDAFIGLEANHPMSLEQHRLGHRWFKTRAWVVGVGYVFPIGGPNSIREFLKWCDAHPEIVATSNEDDLIGKWISKTGRDCWHPIPTIIDHDLSIPSVYGNDHHQHRRPVVTWQGFPPGPLEDPNYWTPSTMIPVLPVEHGARCIFCLEHKPIWTSPKTLAGLCHYCFAKMWENQYNDWLVRRLGIPTTQHAVQQHADAP
jgi:hypothetical protein